MMIQHVKPKTYHSLRWLAGLGGCLLALSVGLAHAEDDWLAVAGSDCQVWSNQPLKAGQTIRWNGGCEAGKVSGSGVLEVVAGDQPVLRFEGTFAAGKAEGQGSLEQFKPEGVERYRGGFKGSLMDGEGVYELANGSRYWGGFKADQPDGSGSYQGTDGTIYVGEIKDGEPQGQGFLVTADGEKYQGEFVKNQRQGTGILLFADGSVYRGHFQDGKADGSGVFLATNGSIYQGVWRECSKMKRKNSAMNIQRTLGKVGLSGLPLVLLVLVATTLPVPPAQAGALGGAVGGAILGGAIGGRRGAAAGTVVGGIAGAAAQNRRRNDYYYNQRGYNRPPPRYNQPSRGYYPRDRYNQR